MGTYDLASQTARHDQARAIARWDVRNRHPLTHHNHNHNNNQENTMATRPSLTTTIAGFVSKDAQIKFLASGQQLAETSIPYTPRRRNQQTGQWEDAGDTTWVDVVVWGDEAEVFSQAATKGTFLTVTGRPQVRAYTTQAGDARAALSVSADSWGVTPRQPRQQQAPGVGTSAARPNAAGQGQQFPQPQTGAQSADVWGANGPASF